jgi:hypothetical protein
LEALFSQIPVVRASGPRGLGALHAQRARAAVRRSLDEPTMWGEDDAD